ncbi:MAG: hypothetical protein LQ342_003142 [Letrouitia transgressa]|nr:MAG: hypothetical protein LQ342_003142 [Letrouitia transgressa]
MDGSSQKKEKNSPVMARLLAWIWIHLLTTLAVAFSVDFNDKDQCAGQVKGHATGSVGSPAGCQTAFQEANSTSKNVAAPGGLFNAVIRPQNDTNKQSGVAFYGQSTCETLIAFGNVPVCMGLGAWASFQFITVEQADDQLTNLDPAPILSVPPNATAVANLSAPATQAASSPPSSAASSSAARREYGPTNGYGPKRRDVQTGKRIEHGSVHRTRRGVYKYHQITARAWRGIPLDQWNEEVHKRNAGGWDEDAMGQNHRRSFSRRAMNPLKARSIDSSKCNLVRSCLIDSGGGGEFGIASATTQLLGEIRRLNTGGDDDWKFLKDPFVVDVVDGSGRSKGLIYAQTRQHSDVGSCSNNGTESDALASALSMGAMGSSVTDMRVDLKLRSGDGVTNTLFVSTRSAGNSDMSIHPICEAIQIFD